MSCSPSPVLTALKASSKGRFSYKSQLDNDVPAADKKRFLDQLASPPSLSPEAVKLITERAKRLSLDTSTSSTCSPRPSLVNHTPSPLHTPKITSSTPHTSHHTPSSLHTSHHHTPSSLHTPRQTSTSHSRALCLNIEEEEEEETDQGEIPTVQGISPGERENPLPPDAPAESSLLDDIKQEQRDGMESLDDRLFAEMNENIRYREGLFKKRFQRIHHDIGEQLAEAERRQLERVEQEEREKRAREEQERIEFEEKQKALQEKLKLQEDEMKAKLKHGEEQKREILRNIEERKRKVVEKLHVQCRELLEAVSGTESKFRSLFQSCSYPQYLVQTVVQKVKGAIATLKSVQQSLERERVSDQPDQTKVSHCHAQLTGLSPILAELKVAVEEANIQGEREEKKQQNLLEAAVKKLEAEKLAKETAAKREADKKAQEEAEKKASEAGKKEEKKQEVKGQGAGTGLSISKSMVESYSSLHDILSQTLSSCASLTNTQDSGLKRYRFDLQKAITGTINSVSSNSGQDLIDKILSLKKLLSGQSVQVGTKSVSVTSHPEAKAYCFNLLAAKIVKQGEDQIASNTQAAFPLAALTVGVWTQFEEVGYYLLAHFYSLCPVLVPMYVNRTKNMSEAEYMKSLGYKISSDGVVENQDLFLNRIRGTVRLYAAIIQTPQLPTSHNPPPHPHGLEHGWAWLARMLNIEPHPVVTAAALGDFLEIAGHSLMKKYTKQFQKLLFALWKEYVPKIEKITPPADRGPLARLTQFLEGCIAAGKIPEPKGCLTDQFWRTRSQGIAIA